MPRLFSLCCCLVIVLSATTQAETLRKTVKTFSSGSPQEVRYYHGTDFVAREVFTEAGARTVKGTIPDGVAREYYDNGRVKSEWHHKDNQRHGRKKSYYEDGTVHTEATFVNDQCHGTTKIYHPNGQLQYEIPYHNGRWHGTVYRHYDSGARYSETLYSAGAKHGVEKTWYANGVLKSTVTYSQGVLHGPASYYYLNNKQASVAAYVAGKLDGLFKSFFESGAIEVERTYRAGRKHGKETRYYTDGTVRSVVMYADDAIEGNGQFFYTDGKKRSIISLKNGNGSEQKWYPGGALESIVHIQANKLHGTAERFFDNGVTRSRIEYENGRRRGHAEAWYPNEQLRSRGTYNTARTGAWLFYFQNGDLLAHETYPDRHAEHNATELFGQLNRADLLFKSRDFNRARVLYRSLLQNSYSAIERRAAFQLGQLAFMQGQYKAAIGHYKIAIKCDPFRAAQSYYNMAMCHAELKNVSTASDLLFLAARLYLQEEKDKERALLCLDRIKVYTPKSHLIEKLNNTIYNIGSTGPNAAGKHNYASGFLLSSGGIVCTNYHTVRDAQDIRVSFPLIKKSFKATLVAKDRDNDLCLLRLTAFDFKQHFTQQIPYTLASAQHIGLGESVFTLGYPYGTMLGKAPKFSQGSITSLKGLKDDPACFQINTPIQPGNSGGPVLDKHGNLVGIVIAMANYKFFVKTTGSLPQNLNFAVKSDYLLSLLKRKADPPSTRELPITELVAAVQQFTVRIEITPRTP
jgi:antitoxin component YwqK of YwqJK toxin-antitoxin module